jgi:DNA-binding beta-propeller fold protein YncE
MVRVRGVHVAIISVGLLTAFGIARMVGGSGTSAQAPTQPELAPVFQLDRSWPKPLPNSWALGFVASVAVDSKDHVWILHRPKQIDDALAADVAAGRKKLPPPVIEFDPQGNVVQSWGGPGPGYSWMEGIPQCPPGPVVPGCKPFPVGSQAEHGIFVDHKDNVWVTGNGHVALKFTRAGKFLLQIGELGKTAGSNDTRFLGNPTDLAVYPKTNEVFIVDGYVNRRIIVFDADTGAYKRHWGAYGKRPDDGPTENYQPDKPIPQQFFASHGLGISKDGRVYVADRHRNRVQVFETDGTFVKEVFIARDSLAGYGLGANLGNGSTWRAGFSADPEQRYLYVPDSPNSQIWILRRSDLEILGSTYSRGNHHMAGADSKGNLYTTGSRSPRRLLFKGVPTTS